MKLPSTVDIKNRLEQRAKELGYSSARQLAIDRGLGDNFVSRMTRKRTIFPSAESLVAMSESFECSIDWLVGRRLEVFDTGLEQSMNEAENVRFAAKEVLFALSTARLIDPLGMPRDLIAEFIKAIYVLKRKNPKLDRDGIAVYLKAQLDLLAPPEKPVEDQTKAEFVKPADASPANAKKMH